MSAETALHLRQTVAWCLHAINVGDLDSSTRSPKLCPDLFANTDHIGRFEAIHQTKGTLQPAVRQVCHRRDQLVQELGLELPSLDFCKIMGRLFCTDFDTDSCEAATDVSHGFFDLSDIPGWDTWFAYEPFNHIQGRVYGWVPNAIVETVGRGILAIPVKSVWWVEELPISAR